VYQDGLQQLLQDASEEAAAVVVMTQQETQEVFHQ
jgi:hypothetical protein